MRFKIEFSLQEGQGVNFADSLSRTEISVNRELIAKAGFVDLIRPVRLTLIYLYIYQ